MELENTIAQQKSIFSQALNTFKSQVDDWKKKYLLVAPIDGKISFAIFLQANQELQANQAVCFIKPKKYTILWGNIYTAGKLWQSKSWAGCVIKIPFVAVSRIW